MTVHSYFGTAKFDDTSVVGKKFADFNASELKDDQSWSWKFNQLEPLGFTHTYKQAENLSEVNCAVTSARTSPAVNHGFKAGTPLKIRGGYKIRNSETATTSAFAKDTEAQDYKIAVVESATKNLVALASSMAFVTAILSF